MTGIDKLDFFKFEREGLDFPFYRNNPKLNIGKWIILGISFIITMVLIIIPSTFGVDFKNLLYFLIPFIGFGIAVSWKYDLICKKFQRNDFKLIITLIVLELIFSIAIAFIMKSVFNIHGQTNPAIGNLDNIIFWIKFPLQIFGEELLKIIPFLIFLTIFYKITDNRKISIVISTVVALIIFGIMHLPTYNNLIYSIIVIGFGSIFTMFGYLKTKNIFVSYLIHLLFDLIPFLGSLLFL